MTVRYTVKQVSGLTGVATDRLRAWERRYGVVEPGRQNDPRVEVIRLHLLAKLCFVVEHRDGRPAGARPEPARGDGPTEAAA